MLTGFLTIAILQTLAVALPGPDFAMVVKNTLGYSRKTGIITSVGITGGVMFHLSYCLLGLAIVISQSILLFTFIKYLGAGYLIFIGYKSLMSKKQSIQTVAVNPSSLSTTQAFRQGLLCNMLNPKATLFFLGLFTLVISPHTPLAIQMSYALEIIAITLIWFCTLSTLLTLPQIQKRLASFQHIINKMIGVLLIIFGTELAIFQRQ